MAALLSGALPLIAQPVIVQPPTNKTASVGHTVTWAPRVNGGPGLRCEWRFARGVQEPSVVSPWSETTLLSLPVLRKEDAGHYWLVARDDSGIVTNPPVHLRVIDAHYLNGGGMNLEIIDGVPGKTNVLQGSTDLRTWVDIVSNTNVSQSTVAHYPQTEDRFYFYRVLPLP